MTNKQTELIKELSDVIGNIPHISSSEIPNIDLYMDQVTTFMEDHLNKNKRNEEDKIMTKTMINNYAKNDLIPSPIKKKYNKEHMILLIFIYYYKNFLSINDINKVIAPLIENYSSIPTGKETKEEKSKPQDSISIAEVYDRITDLMKEDTISFTENIDRYLKIASESFNDADENTKDYLQMFTLLNLLSHDICNKLMLVEAIIDSMNSEETNE